MTTETSTKQSGYYYVTREIIDFAVPRDSGHCMFAEAIRAEYPDAHHISVDVQTMRFSRGDKRYTYLTPRICAVNIINFDRELKPEPFRFRLISPQITPCGSVKKRAALMKIEGDKGSGTGGVAAPKRPRAPRIKLKDKTTGGIVRIEGGTPLPEMKLADGIAFNRRRAFGLRALRF